MYYFFFTLLLFIASCNGGGGGLNPDIVVSQNPLSIKDKSQLIGGPLAHGQIGDVLLQNDKIRVIIQQPSKFAQSCPFGGVIIDADIVRTNGEGQDNFGKMCPLVNVEWTVNYDEFQVVSTGKDGGPIVVKALGNIDVLDYLDLDFVSPVAKALTGQTMYYSPRFDDANDPFSTYDDLRGVNTRVATEYTLESGANYVKMVTTFENNGDQEVMLPIGRLVNGSGQLQTLIPNLGFSPPTTAQITGDTAAVIYAPFDGVDVSYGYFYDVNQFTKEEATATNAQKALAGSSGTVTKTTRQISTSLTYSGVTGVLLGEEFLKVLPIGGPSELKVNFIIPAQGSKSFTDYFVVGNGDPASVFAAGLKAIKVPTHEVSGKVVDGAGNTVGGATVVVQNETNMTVIIFKSGDDGSFKGQLSTGADDFAKAFGSGRYKLFVQKAGYHKNGTTVAGECDPKEIDVTIISEDGITCTLGASGTVALSGGVTDADTGKAVPARLTIVGFDPSPEEKGAGNFEDTGIFERPWGVVDVKYVNAKGEFGLGEGNSFKLEPGHYAFVFSRGTEYALYVKEADVSSGGTLALDNVKLKRVVKTPGWVSGDFHLHSIQSPDSAILTERRTLAAVGEGMDVLQSSDHDWLVDYGPVVKKLEESGVLLPASVATLVGQEISPNHIGHINVFPLAYDPNKIDGGALDWTYSPLDTNDPSPDFVMSPRDIIDHYNSGGGGEGEKVLQVNHLADQTTSMLIVSSWVTTPAYKGIEPLSSYVEPSAQRVHPDMSTTSIPLSYGDSDLVISNFTSLELSISSELYNNKLRETGLPQWFNLLNLGVLVTGTANSDSHKETIDQLGMPRNFVASDIDPRDGKGGYGDLNKDDFAKAVNEHRVVVSAGPFISVSAENEEGQKTGVGGTIHGKNVKLHVEVQSPSWAWFDTIEVYANTEPLPADEDGVSTFKGVASDPKSFFQTYHVPKFYYEPNEIFATSDGSLKNWKEEGGLITASADIDMNVEEDTWVVIFVYGDKGSKDWRSLFPVVTKSVADPSKAKTPDAGWTLESLARDPAMAAEAWGFANPIFIDVDGDTNGDGNPFEAKYIRNGVSPLAK